MDRTGREEVEQVEGKLSGVPILKGTVYRPTSCSTTTKARLSPSTCRLEGCRPGLRLARQQTAAHRAS